MQSREKASRWDGIVKKLKRFFSEFADNITLDTRALALTRIGLAILILLDLGARYTDLAAHYGPNGLLPEDSYHLFYKPYFWSLHVYAGLTKLKVLFVVNALCGLAMLVGFRTRLAVFLVWVFALSLQARNPVICNSGDVLLRIFLFWLMFLPLGRHYAVDMNRKPNRILDNANFVAMVSFAFTFQFLLIYVFAAIAKSHPCWMITGKATEMALCIDNTVSPFGLWFKETFRPLLEEATFSVLAWEALAPIAFFFSARTSKIRAFSVVGFIFMHLSFGLMMRIGFFSPIAMAGLLSLLPTWLLTSRAETERSDFPTPSETKFGAANIVCALVLTFLLHSIVAWNFAMQKKRVPGFGRTKLTRIAILYLRLDQNWGMFAPHPFVADGWIELPAKFEDGTTFDLFWRENAPLGKKPKDAADGFPNIRWRKYFMYLQRKKHRKYRKYLGRYLCSTVNETPGPRGKMTSFRVLYYLERTTFEAKELRPRRVLLLKKNCLKKSKASNDNKSPK